MGSGASVDGGAVTATDAKELAGARFDGAKWGALPKDGEGKVSAKDWNGLLAEEELLPPPPEVQLWLDKKFDIGNAQGKVTAQGKAALPWLQRALTAAHQSKEVKKQAKALLGISFFTYNLGFLQIFDPLQSYCRDQALKFGEPVQTYYREQDLATVLGKLEFKPVEGIDPNTVRQDALVLGLPLPPHKEGWTDMAEEDVFIHMLRLMALGLQKRFDDKVAAIVGEHGGEDATVKTCPMKGHARMTNKMVSAEDHRYEAKPRPAENIDIVRTCVTLATPKDLVAVAEALCASFHGKGVARAKNMFAFSEERAAVQFHYRTLMLNLVMAPDGLTFGVLASEAAALWDGYMARRPDNPKVPWGVWRTRAKAALAHLRSEAVKELPVRMVVEVQLVLKPYLDARLKMHLLYKVVRAADDNALSQDFAPKLVDDGRTYAEVQKEKREETEAFVKEGGDVDRDRNAGWTKLMDMASGGFVDAVKVLFEQGADANKAANDGKTPLYMAAMKGHVDVARLLLEKGADANKAANTSATPLYIAAQNGHVDVARLLLEQGADANKAVNDGRTALYAAAMDGHVDVARLLLEQGADANKAVNNGATPLLMAAEKGHVDVVRLLLEQGADANKASKDGRTSLYAAAMDGHVDVARLLLEQGADANKADNDGMTPLYWAAQKGHVDVVRLLLEQGADANKADNDGMTPLYMAAQTGHVDVVRLLLEQGADANKADNDGVTPLYIAALSGHVDVARLLLEQGASVNPPKEDGQSPLHRAADNGHADMVKLLLEAGAERGGKDKWGDTPLSNATNNKHIEVVVLLS